MSRERELTENLGPVAYITDTNAARALCTQERQMKIILQMICIQMISVSDKFKLLSTCNVSGWHEHFFSKLTNVSTTDPGSPPVFCFVKNGSVC